MQGTSGLIFVFLFRYLPILTDLDGKRMS